MAYTRFGFAGVTAMPTVRVLAGQPPTGIRLVHDVPASVACTIARLLLLSVMFPEAYSVMEEEAPGVGSHGVRGLEEAGDRRRVDHIAVGIGGVGKQLIDLPAPGPTVVIGEVCTNKLPSDAAVH